MKFEYILNLKRNTLHLRVDGMTHESCNLDQLQSGRYKVFETLPDYNEAPWISCRRCIKNLK